MSVSNCNLFSCFVTLNYGDINRFENITWRKIWNKENISQRQIFYHNSAPWLSGVRHLLLAFVKARILLASCERRWSDFLCYRTDPYQARSNGIARCVPGNPAGTGKIHTLWPHHSVVELQSSQIDPLKALACSILYQHKFKEEKNILRSHHWFDFIWQQGIEVALELIFRKYLRLCHRYDLFF